MNKREDEINILREGLARLRTELDALKRDIDKLKNQINILPIQFKNIIFISSGFAGFYVLAIAFVGFCISIGYYCYKKWIMCHIHLQVRSRRCMWHMIHRLNLQACFSKCTETGLATRSSIQYLFSLGVERGGLQTVSPLKPVTLYTQTAGEDTMGLLRFVAPIRLLIIPSSLKIL